MKSDRATFDRKVPISAHRAAINLNTSDRHLSSEIHFLQLEFCGFPLENILLGANVKKAISLSPLKCDNLIKANIWKIGRRGGTINIPFFLRFSFVADLHHHPKKKRPLTQNVCGANDFEEFIYLTSNLPAFFGLRKEMNFFL